MKMLTDIQDKVAKLLGLSPAAGTNDRDSRQTRAPVGSRQRAKELVKPRPMSMSLQWEVIQDDHLGDETFFKIRQQVFEHIDRQRFEGGGGALRSKMFCETGRIQPGRPYFFLKPTNEIGWLFERSGPGWVISRAEKIVGQDMFLRRGDPWDIVSLYGTPDGAGSLRVSSPRMKGELLSLAIYRMKLLQNLELNYAQS